MLNKFKPNSTIPYGRQSISNEDINSVVKVLQSDYLTQGNSVPIFESKLSSYVGAKYAVATSNGTSALHIACLALGLDSNDYLWTTPISFVASANCGLYCGAKVDFVDINPSTYNIDIDKLSYKLREAKKENKLPSIIVVVHFSGLSCDMDKIKELSTEYEFKIIEDACHALGGSYKNNKIGSCSYSDVTVFSFHPVKIITTGEGGMATTNNKSYADNMRLLRSHGITRDVNNDNKKNKPWYYEQVSLGFNYRMSDIQAALGVSQLGKIDSFIEKRNQIFSKYIDLLSSTDIQLPFTGKDYYSANHLFVIRIKLDKTNRKHYEVFKYLLDNNIGANLHYIPIYRQPYYNSFGYKKTDFPESEKYYKEAITLPIYPELRDDEVEYIVDMLKNSLK